MNTANQPTSTSSSESCNTMGRGEGTQDKAVPREPWWEEVGRLVDAFEAELAAAAIAKTCAGTTH